MRIILSVILLFYVDSSYAQQTVKEINSLIAKTKKKHLFSIKNKSSYKTGHKDRIHRIDTTYYFDKRSKLPVAVMIKNVVWDSASTTIFRFYEGELIGYHHDYTIRSGETGYQKFYFTKGAFIDKKVRNPKPKSSEEVLAEATKLYAKAQDKLTHSP